MENWNSDLFLHMIVFVIYFQKYARLSELFSWKSYDKMINCSDFINIFKTPRLIEAKYSLTIVLHDLRMCTAFQNGKVHILKIDWKELFTSKIVPTNYIDIKEKVRKLLSWPCWFKNSWGNKLTQNVSPWMSINYLSFSFMTMFPRSHSSLVLSVLLFWS